ncbi:gp53-like domain-containing protein [Enterobacter roggenkampii]|uniref:Putative tail fiber protein gp53-like C-terminal domain-containing protein n=1 Tax=Enterobacter roggenkampii TaxID=1812935 RepID=A0ABD7KBS1_9ENTR|nr:hypothetical protein [Enterobacter roggenkampii]SAB32056.1 Uncharacterised protein [Enterobacter roggenkampii]
MKPLMPPIDTPDKLFHDGNPATGAEGTIVPAEHLNNEQASIRDLQSEMIAILTAAAMAPESTAGQLLAALNKLYAPGNDTLGALASLVGAANKLPYFTGPKGAALTDLTAFARTLLSRSDAAGVLSDLGLDRLQQTAGGTTLSSANKSTFLFIDPDKWGVFDGSKNVALAIDAGGTGADTVDGALKNLGLDTALADKQTKDTTLTALSGKTVAQLLAYLTLGPIASAADITAGTANKLIDAYGLNAYFPARGFSAYGYIRIPNQPGGLILQWGQVPPIPAGGSLIVNYTMAFPGGFLTVIPMAGSSPAAANAVLAAGGGDSKSSFQVFNSLPGVTHETGSGIYLALGF